MGVGRRSGCWNGSCSGAAIQYPLYNTRLASSKTGFWPKTAFRAPGGHSANRNKQFWKPFSKMENVVFSPGDPLYNTRISFAFNAKSVLLQKIRVAIRVPTPAFSSISFLLTAHARVLPPTESRLRSGGWDWRLGLAVGAGSWGIYLLG